jgi:hypothetical protein
MLKSVTKNFLVGVCCFVAWPFFLWFSTLLVVMMAFAFSIVLSSGKAVVDLLTYISHQGLIGSFMDLFLGSYLGCGYIMAPMRSLVPFILLFVNYILVILSILNAASFKCMLKRSLIVIGYVACLQALIWRFTNDISSLTDSTFLTELFILVIASLCFNAVLYRYLFRNQEQLKLKATIKYLTTIER